MSASRDVTAILSGHPNHTGLPVSRTKEVPLFLSYFKTLSIGLAPGIEPATSRSAVKRSTDWDNPAAKFWFADTMQKNWFTTWFIAEF